MDERLKRYAICETFEGAMMMEDKDGGYVSYDAYTTERDTLAKALVVAVKALREVNEQSGKYFGCRCSLEENGGLGDCWPCRMVMIGFIPQEALSEIERIKGEK